MKYDGTKLKSKGGRVDVSKRENAYLYARRTFEDALEFDSSMYGNRPNDDTVDIML